jgi:hypothetical protein
MVTSWTGGRGRPSATACLVRKGHQPRQLLGGIRTRIPHHPGGEVPGMKVP